MKQIEKIKELKNNDEGLTLIELLVAILLLGLIVGAFLSGFAFSTKTNIKSGKIVEEAYVAQACMEEIVELSYAVSSTETHTATYNLYDVINGTNKDIIDEDGKDKYIIKREQDGYYVKIILIEESEDIDGTPMTYTKILIDVYDDSSYSDSVARLQNIIVM